MPDKFFVDSNIFLYAFSNIDLNKQRISKEIILRSATISTQVINEVSKNLLQKFHFSENQIKEFINSTFMRYEVVSLNREIFITASNLRNIHFFSYFDSIIVSSAIFSDCSTLYSEDMQANRVINGVLRIVNPYTIS